MYFFPCILCCFLFFCSKRLKLRINENRSSDNEDQREDELKGNTKVYSYGKELQTYFGDHKDKSEKSDVNQVDLMDLVNE